MKLKLSKILDYITLYAGHPFRYVVGIYAKKYNKEWDKLLNNWLDHAPYEVSKHTIRFKPRDIGGYIDVWIGNEWYSYGYMDTFNGKAVNFAYRPSLKTMMRLHTIVKPQHKSQEKEVIDFLSSLNKGGSRFLSTKKTR